MRDIWMFLQQTAAASIVAFFILFLQSLFRDKLSPKWQYTIWLVLLARLVVPAGWGVGTSLDISGWLDTARVAGELKLNSAWSSPWDGLLPAVGLPALPAGGAPRSVTDWLFALYLAGVLVCAAWLLLGWRKLRQTVKHAVPVAGQRLEQVRALAAEYGLMPPAQVLESRAVQGPFLMGVFHPTLVVPMGWQVDGKVILHELLHRKNQDVAAGWVTALFRCVHWCNPFLWRVFDRIDNQREQRCDQQVLERLEGEDRRDYGRVLLSMAEDRALRVPGATSMANGGEHIKQRIQAISRFKTFPQGMGLVSVCMTLILLPNLVLGFSAAAVGESHNWTSSAQVLSYAQRNRCTTVVGALDAYAKSVYYYADDPYSALLCRAMVTPEDEMPLLMEQWDRMWQSWEDDPDLRGREMDEAYRNGPVIRGMIEDGNGGYLCQVYFFRREYEEPGEGVEMHIGWLRHTVAVTPGKWGSWEVRPLAEATGQTQAIGYANLKESLEIGLLPSNGLELGEPPLRYWKATWQGVEAEIWSECYLSMEDVLTDHSVDMRAWSNSMYQIGDEQFRSLPRMNDYLGWVNGELTVRLTNHGEETVRVNSIQVNQHWPDPALTSANTAYPGMFQSSSDGGQAGCDVQMGPVELLPGESVTLLSNGGGTTGAPVEICLLPTSLTGALEINGQRLYLKNLEMVEEVNLD